LLGPQLIEIRMTNIGRVAAALAIPRLLEWQFAQHVVDEASHFADPPAGPGPELRRAVIKHGNAMCLCPPGDPPVEARVIDQHDRVRPMMAEVAIGAACEVPELVNVQQHASEPHHGQLRQVFVQRAPGSGHPRPTVADKLAFSPSPAQFANEIGAVQVATGLAYGEKDPHRMDSAHEFLGWPPASSDGRRRSMAKCASTEKLNSCP
jgi:hypothetical protein